MTQDIHFKPTMRKIYPRTFLNTVFVIFDYDTAMEPANKIPRIQNFIKDNFNLEINLKEEGFSSGFSIDSKDGGHSYYFTRGSIGVKYMGNDYVSFTETMMPLIYRLVTFIKNVLSISATITIRIRKVNILNAREYDGTLVSDDQLIQDFLSQELTEVAEPVNDYTELELENVKEFKGTTDKDLFAIHFGIHNGTLPDGGQFVGLVLDESVSRNHVSLNTVDEALISVNEKVFNMFHWSVSSNVIALMSQEL